MPKTHRDFLKRQVAHSYCDIERGMEHLAAVWKTFENPHPELAKTLSTALQGAQLALDLIRLFTVKSWGKAPKEYQTWRNLKELNSVEEITARWEKETAGQESTQR